MPSKLITSAAAMLAAGAIAACGSSSSSSSSASSSSTSTSTSSATSSAAPKLKSVPVQGHTVTTRFPGITGSKLNVADVKRFRAPARHGLHAHVNGFAGLSLTQKLSASLHSAVSFWQAVFSKQGGQLPAGNAVLVAGTPAACGSSQVTASSQPSYCPPSDTLFFTLGTITANIAPLGDSALLLLTSDLYGYHIENALGALSKGYSGAQLELMDSCFSGVYFAEIQGALAPSDEAGVNAFMAQLAPASGSTAPGSVTASDLATAFNKGLESHFKFQTCVPS